VRLFAFAAGMETNLRLFTVLTLYGDHLRAMKSRAASPSRKEYRVSHTA
jgi:hypothetical protein